MDELGIEFDSPTWAGVKAWALAREAQLKEALVMDNGEAATARLRGQVAVVRELMALEELARMEPEAEPEY